jgi:uncharacterized caspase-like protein
MTAAAAVRALRLRLARALLAGLCLAAMAPPSAVAAPGRWALVIGNDAYAKVEPLRNAVADAGLIAGELKRAGFEVATIKDADRRTMLREVIELARRAEAGGEAVVYFAGHGVQVANTNYLLPVDFDGADEAMLPFEAVSLTEVGNQLLDAKTRFSLLIIDACRNNPLPSRRGRNLRTGPGLAPMSPATGQMVVYSAGSGQVALDGLGDRDPIRNGVFAREFAREMRTPGIDVREMMLTVRESVERLASSVNHAQRPAIYDESRGRFVFHEAPSLAGASKSAGVAGASDALRAAPATLAAGTDAAAAPGAAAAGRGKSAEQIEDELWATFSGSNSRAGYAAYLREYPAGRYAAAARVQLEVLGQVDRPARAPEGGADSAAKPAAALPQAPPQAPPAVAAAPASDNERPSGAPIPGKRYRGIDGQFDLTVEVRDGALLVEAFRMTTGRFNGAELRCGMFSNKIDLDEQHNVSAWCSGAIPGSLRLRGRFPRIDIYTSGALGGGTIDLVEVTSGR